MDNTEQKQKTEKQIYKEQKPKTIIQKYQKKQEASVSQIFSQIFEGEVSFEVLKQKEKKVREQTFSQIEYYLNQYAYMKVPDSKQIFILENDSEYDINLQLLLEDQVLPKDQYNIQTLNTVLIILHKILKDYIILQYQKEALIDLYEENKELIEQTLEKLIIKQCKAKEASRKQLQLLKKFPEQLSKQIIYKLKSNYEQSDKNDFAQVKQVIKEQKYCSRVYFKKQIKEYFHFKVSELILNKYLKRIQIALNKNITMIIKPYAELNFNQSNFELFKTLQYLYKEYLKWGQFKGGIADDTLNDHLKNLVFLIKWKNKNNQFLNLIMLIDKIQKHSKQSNCEIYNFIKELQKEQEFESTIQQDEFKQITQKIDQLKHQQIDSIKYWNKSVDNKTNLLVIFQLFILVSGIEAKENSIQFGRYCPVQRKVLVKLIRLLQNGWYKYLNIQVIKILEFLTSNLIASQYEYLVEKLKLSKDDLQSLDLQKCSSVLQEYALNFTTQNQLKNEQQWRINLIDITKQQIIMEDNQNQTQQEAQYQFLKDYYFQKHISLQQQDNLAQKFLLNQMQIIKKKYLPEIDIPKEFNIQSLAGYSQSSRIITICISGFTSEEDDKKKIWNCVKKQFGGEVYTVQWKSGTYGQIVKHVGNVVINQIRMLLFSSKDSSKNPFDAAYDEAKRVGKYLGHLIGNQQIFKNSIINLVGFSLGTLVLQNCIQELDKIYQIQKVKYLNQVVMLGGVVDVFELANMRSHSISNQFYNVYSKKDSILKYILKLDKWKVTPCGLNQIKSNYDFQKILNFDFTPFIKGHLKYDVIFELILLDIDFDNDVKIFYS